MKDIAFIIFGFVLGSLGVSWWLLPVAVFAIAFIWVMS